MSLTDLFIEIRELRQVKFLEYDNGSQWRLKGTPYYFVPFYPSWYDSESGIYISFEKVIQDVDKEIARELIFHMDLFV